VDAYLQRLPRNGCIEEDWLLRAVRNVPSRSWLPFLVDLFRPSERATIVPGGGGMQNACRPCGERRAWFPERSGKRPYGVIILRGIRFDRPPRSVSLR
jgi:hypothetical protein